MLGPVGVDCFEIRVEVGVTNDGNEVGALSILASLRASSEFDVKLVEDRLASIVQRPEVEGAAHLPPPAPLAGLAGSAEKGSEVMIVSGIAPSQQAAMARAWASK